MLLSTLDIVQRVLETDPTVSPSDRKLFLAVLRDGAARNVKPVEPVEKQPNPRIKHVLRRAEVARILGRSLRTIDQMAQDGTLHKHYFKGRKRASGFLESEVSRVLRPQEVDHAKCRGDEIT